LGFGGNDTAPKFDDAGRAISGLASNTSGRDGGLPLAALQAIAVAAGVGQAAAGRTPTIRAEVSRSKVAKTLEVKVEAQWSLRRPRTRRPMTTSSTTAGTATGEDEDEGVWWSRAWRRQEQQRRPRQLWAPKRQVHRAAESRVHVQPLSDAGPLVPRVPGASQRTPSGTAPA
jgi:hypothetical protein